MLAPMGAGLDIARLKLPLRFFRYFLSRPSFDIDRNPAVLTVMLQRPWRRARAVVVAAFVLILGAVAIHAVRLGSSVLVDDLSDSLLPLIAMAAFWAALTFGQKRLLASFGDSEVTVQEGIADGAPDEVGPVTRRREPLTELARGRTRFVEVDEAGGTVHDRPIVSAGTRPRRAQMPISG